MNNRFTLSTGAAHAGAILGAVGGLALVLAAALLPVAVLIGVILALRSLYQSICHLGSKTLAVQPEFAGVVAASVIATLVALCIAVVVLALRRKRRTLLLAGLSLVLWLTLAVLLALIDTWITLDKRIEAEVTLLRIGVFVYSALPALPVIPLVLLAASASHEQEDQYPTLAAAGGATMFTLLKVLLAVAMFAFEAFFGVALGINPIAAVFAGLLNAIAFSMALGNLNAAAKDGDRDGVTQWGFISTFYALLMFAIATEAIIKLSRASGTTTQLDALALPPFVSTAAQFAFVSSIGLSALLLALTYWRAARREAAGGGSVIEGEAREVGVHPTPLRRLAGSIRGLRGDLAEVKAALTDSDRARAGNVMVGRESPVSVPEVSRDPKAHGWEVGK
ncbi:MAG: hypothetical protein RMN52_02340 [Anaerolineae bacterium]|nr:hypothetical protein [Candidatus Roseilinea sp.]MDW8448820.1 hypothetical protein [Anaerolineae bacterium]